MFFFSSHKQLNLGYVFAIGSLLSGGSFNALAKDLTPYLSPFSLLFLSEFLTCLFIILSFGFFPLLRAFRSLSWTSVFWAGVVGLCNSVLSPLLWYTGLSSTSASNASILSCVDIIMILFASRILLHESIERMQYIGVSIILCGILAMNIQTNAHPLFVLNAGDFLLITSGFVSGIGVVIYKKYLSAVMPELAILIRTTLAATCVGAFILLSSGHSLRGDLSVFPVTKIISLLVFAFFARYINLTFFYQALDRLPAHTLSMIQIVSPLSGLFFAWLLLHESLQYNQVFGVILILLGVFVEHFGKPLSSHLSLARFFHGHGMRQG
jgi:drug/metabolite transporter (DMT)-like permease